MWPRGNGERRKEKGREGKKEVEEGGGKKKQLYKKKEKSVYLRLNGGLLAIFSQPADIHLTVKMANVAADCIIPHLHKVFSSSMPLHPVVFTKMLARFAASSIVVTSYPV